ncbi:sodium/pantothenate symporter [Gillisia sp. Hel1_33_143]|uniref:sodium/pantothenate symporter n=1 Tax=Gillisia sp. Hel1_33_143 TaxID=1336796 RepID=UPI00087BD84A|nr:sodium:solute symporter [Gillisia sp. Hel1_33_143]SDR72847.1 sodium/pantothenate symporter [Gillisia sp. Hel1_33_143]
MFASETWSLYVTLLLVVYSLVIIFFVVRGMRKTKNIDDFAIGSNGFPAWAVGLSLAASMTSAATFIINPGFIALYGFAGIISFGVVMPIAIFASLIFFTKAFQKHGSTVKALTMAQWIGKRYDSKGLTIFFAFLSLLLITFIVLICVGLTQIISKSLNLEPFYVLLGLVIFVFGYMMFGGANSMVYTNTIQAVLMFIVALILILSGAEYFNHGIEGFINTLKDIDPQLVKTTNEKSFLFRDYFEIISCQIVIGIAIVCQPHIITKSLFLKDAKSVNKYLFVAISCMTVFFLVVFVGLYARITFPDLAIDGVPLKMDELVSAYVVKTFTAGVGVLIVAGLISAGLSTLEGLIQSLSTTISTDLITPLFPSVKKISSVALNKIVIILLAIVSFWLSHDQIINPNVSVAIFAQNGVYAYFAAAFVPVLFGIYFKKVSKNAVFIASFSAVALHFIIYYGRITPYMQEPVNNPGVSAAIAIVASFIIGNLLYLFSKKKV